MQVFDCHKSQKIYEKAVFTCLLMLDYVLDYYKTQELYDKVLALFWAQTALKKSMKIAEIYAFCCLFIVEKIYDFSTINCFKNA